MVLLAYHCLPFIHLGAAWPVGLISVIALVITPALLLAHWTMTGTHLYARAILQPILWAAFLLWLIPVILLVPTQVGWGPLLHRPIGLQLIYALPLLVPAYLIINALYVFARDGGGTGFPYDPPKRLVTTGIYAHLSNPMQLGICLLMAWWGVMVESVYVSATSLVAVLLFTVFKQICNGSSQVGKTDPQWAIYQRNTPKWWPRKNKS